MKVEKLIRSALSTEMSAQSTPFKQSETTIENKQSDVHPAKKRKLADRPGENLVSE